MVRKIPFRLSSCLPVRPPQTSLLINDFISVSYVETDFSNTFDPHSPVLPVENLTFRTGVFCGSDPCHPREMRLRPGNGVSNIFAFYSPVKVIFNPRGETAGPRTRGNYQMLGTPRRT